MNQRLNKKERNRNIKYKRSEKRTGEWGKIKERYGERE